ncbi:hypothetical protein V2J09_001062, partial [Rumex salicifolius]
QRDHIEVLDEPLYVPYLCLTGAKRPYPDELISTMENDEDKVMKEPIFAPGKKPYRYCKHIANQCLPGVKSDLLKKGKHFILIRNPLYTLASLDKVIPSSFIEIGYPDLVSIYCKLCELGKAPPIIDATDLQLDPEGTLHGLCKDLGISFQPAMLKWEAGPKPVDCVVAPWWYEDVHKTTCFLPPKKYPKPFPVKLYDLLEECLPFYNFLKRHAQRTSLLKSPLPIPNLPLLENTKLLVWVGDEILPRDNAKVSVFDSVVQGGDLEWEGFRVYNGRVFKLEEHLDRLLDSAKALAFSNLPTRDEISITYIACMHCIIENAGEGNHYFWSGNLLFMTTPRELSLVSASTPQNSPNVSFDLICLFDSLHLPRKFGSKIHHNNLLNNILAKIEGNNANADDAIMLDKDGCFLVKRGRVMDLVVNEGLILEERRISQSEFHTADERDDIEVLDEPLYVPYLRLTGAKRPYRDELLSTMENDGDKVMKEAILAPGKKPYRYCKASFDKVIPSSFIEIGLPDLVSVYCELCELGKAPPIIDAADLQKDPEGTLRSLCKDLGIPFQTAMLKWEAGPKPVDGVFAPWWYEDVHKTTCFLPPKKYPKPFPMELYDLLEECLPFYNFLRHHAKKTSLLNLPSPNISLPLPENSKLLVWVGDEILPRDSAKVSVFDSVVQGGDSVWEGLRVYNGRIFKLEEHLDRLFDSAKALAFSNLPTRDEVKEAIFATLNRNGTFDNVHIHLSLTRGKKVTSGMSPAFNLYGCTLIVLPEWKSPIHENSKGIVLVTATTRRNSPNNLDPKIHHNNLLNNILAKIEANKANADDAIMLDKDGYVSETNATNIFLVKRGRVITPHSDHCLPGITRSAVMDLAVKEGLSLEERRISLSEFHTADEVWTTGTMGELTPVVKIDGRVIGDGNIGPVTRKIQSSFKNLTLESGVPIPTYQKP